MFKNVIFTVVDGQVRQKGSQSEMILNPQTFKSESMEL